MQVKIHYTDEMFNDFVKHINFVGICSISVLYNLFKNKYPYSLVAYHNYAKRMYKLGLIKLLTIKGVIHVCSNKYYEKYLVDVSRKIDELRKQCIIKEVDEYLLINLFGIYPKECEKVLKVIKDGKVLSERKKV